MYIGIYVYRFVGIPYTYTTYIYAYAYSMYMFKSWNVAPTEWVLENAGGCRIKRKGGMCGPGGVWSPHVFLLKNLVVKSK